MPTGRFDPSELEKAVEAAALASAKGLVERGSPPLPRAESRGRHDWYNHARSIQTVAFAAERQGFPAEYVAHTISSGRALVAASRRSLLAAWRYDAVWSWLEALRLLDGRLPRREAGLWRGALLRECDYLARQVALRRGRSGSTAWELATSPNHYIRWVSTVSHGGRVLGRKAWVELGDSEADRFVADMHPDGYWPEHHGPALRYNIVSLRGMAQWRRSSWSRRHDAALRRAVDLYFQTSYPDGVPIATLDGRNRHSPHWGSLDLADVFSLSPMGRRWLSELPGTKEEAPSRASRRARGAVAGLASAFECLGRIEAGPTAPLPWESTESRFALSDLPAAVRRSGAWTVAVSGIHTPYWPHNPFFLERQELLSVHHRDCGLIIGGGNDKNHPASATLALFEGGEIWYNVPRPGGRVRRRSPAAEELSVELGPCSGKVVVTPRSPRRLEVVLSMSPRTLDDECHVGFQVQLPLGESFAFDGERRCVKESRVELRARRTGSVLDCGRWRMRIPAPAALVFPHLPWNGYGWPSYASGMEAAVGLVTANLGPRGGELKVTIEVPR